MTATSERHALSYLEPRGYISLISGNTIHAVNRWGEELLVFLGIDLYEESDDELIPLPKDALVAHAPLSDDDIERIALDMADIPVIATNLHRLLNPEPPDPSTEEFIRLFGGHPDELDRVLTCHINLVRAIFIHSNYSYTREECGEVATRIMQGAGILCTQ